MRAGVMMAQRPRRSHRGDTGAAASAGGNAGHVEARPTVTVHVPLAFRQHRGRKVLVAPDGTDQRALAAGPSPTRTQREVTPAMRALARAFRWRRLLETGVFATVQEIAAAENINSSYVSRILRLTLLAPEMVEASVAGTEAGGVTLDRLMLPFPIAWEMQTSVGYKPLPSLER